MKTYIIDEKIDQGLQVFVDTAQQELESPFVKKQAHSMATQNYSNKRSMLSDMLLFCFLISIATLVYCFFNDKSVWATIERVYFQCIVILLSCIFLGRKYYFVQKSNERNFTTTFSETKIQPNRD